MVEVGAQPVDEHLAEGLAPPGEVGEHGGVDVADANADARGILIFDATARARLEAAVGCGARGLLGGKITVAPFIN